MFVFFKQEAAYEVRISDWSSDVCSSDLAPSGPPARHGEARAGGDRAEPGVVLGHHQAPRAAQVDLVPPLRDPRRPLSLRRRLARRHPRIRPPRSDEHTSELQSLMRNSYSVFYLKKKTKKQHAIQP